MKYKYYGLTKDGLWIKIISKEPIRNLKQASTIAKEEIIKCVIKRA